MNQEDRSAERRRRIADTGGCYEYSDAGMIVELDADGLRIVNRDQDLLSDPADPGGPFRAWAFKTTSGPPGAASDTIYMIAVVPNGIAEGPKFVWDRAEQKYVVFRPPKDSIGW